MRFVRFSSLAGLAALASACSGPAVPDHVAASSAAIVDGLPSTSEEDFVVHLYVTGQGSCTGTLVAPNTVLTALHCISEFDLLKTFACNNDGSVSPIQEGGGILGPQLAPERVEIRIGPRPLDDPPSAFGSRIFGTGSNTVCHDDLALIVLDRNLEPPPQRLRFQERIIRGDSELIVGYGQTDSESSGIRNRRTGVRVVAVGAYGSYRAQGVAIDNTFVVGEGSCHGDSGGPAIDEETGAVTGVASLLENNDCVNSDRNVFTQVAPFEALVREALDFAGFEPLVESNGQGGEGGSGSGEPGTGGIPAGGTGTQTGGTPGVGEGGMAGSDTGEGGEGALSGATGGTGGNGATAGSNGQAGRNLGQAGTAEVPGEGSGSRGDADCACRLDGPGSSRGAGWAGFLSLLAVALLRRRAR